MKVERVGKEDLKEAFVVLCDRCPTAKVKLLSGRKKEVVVEEFLSMLEAEGWRVIKNGNAKKVLCNECLRKREELH